MALAKNRLSLLTVGSVRIILVISLLMTFFSWQKASALTATDMSWSWTYDGERGLQVVMVLGNTWTNSASTIAIVVDGTAAETITAPAAGVIIAEKVEGITTAPTTVLLNIFDGNGALLDATDEVQAAGDLVPAALGWTSQAQGNKSLIQVVLPASGLPTNVAAVEVYPNFTAGDSPKKTTKKSQGGDLPTGVVIDILVTGLIAPATSYRVQFLDNSGHLLTFSEGTSANSSVVSSTTTRIPVVVESSSSNIAVPIATATPVPAVAPSLPGTGDYTLGSGMIGALMIIGSLIILMGGTYVFTNRRTE
jgi:hypothetical protein